MQKFLRCNLYISLIFVSLIFFPGCQDASTKIIDAGNAAALIDTVWAGETPREGDWLTITFRPKGKVIWEFSIDNTTNEWNYSFNFDNEGIISIPGGGWNPAPHGFTVNGDTLSIVNFGNHAPDANPPVVHNFQRYR